jgi:hypothetical protein
VLLLLLLLCVNNSVQVQLLVLHGVTIVLQVACRMVLLPTGCVQTASSWVTQPLHAHLDDILPDFALRERPRPPIALQQEPTANISG